MRGRAKAVLGGLLWLGLAFMAGAADEVFSIPHAGIQLTKPADWRYLFAEKNPQEPEVQTALQTGALIPLASAVKHPEPYQDFNPQLRFALQVYSELRGKKPEEIIALIAAAQGKDAKDFELAQAPLEVTVSGIRSAYVRMNYNMGARNGSFPGTTELWLVPFGGYHVMIAARTRQDEKTGTREEIQAIVASLRIGREGASGECRAESNPDAWYARYEELSTYDVGRVLGGEQRIRTFRAMFPEEVREARDCLFKAFEAGSCRAISSLEWHFRGGRPTLDIPADAEQADEYLAIKDASCKTAASKQE